MTEESFQHTLSNGVKVNFISSENIPVNYCYWNTVDTYQTYTIIKKCDAPLSDLIINIFYNIPDKFVIDSIKDNVETIFKSYIITSNSGSNIFREVPNFDSKLPSWTSYNPEFKMFAFESDLFFKIKIDTSIIRQCSYLTSSQSVSQISDHYQYANLTNYSVCSNSLITKNSINPTPCLFSNGIFSNTQSLISCSGYQPDEKIIYTNLLTHKTSGNSFIVETILYRSLQNSYKVEVINKSTNTVFSTLSYDSMSFPKDKSALHQEILITLNSLLDLYSEDYNIETTYDYTVSNAIPVSVNIKSKNSYISNLISKDSHVIENSQILQTV